MKGLWWARWTVYLATPAVMTHPRPGTQGVGQRRSGQDVSVMVHLGDVVIVCSTTQ